MYILVSMLTTSIFMIQLLCMRALPDLDQNFPLSTMMNSFYQPLAPLKSQLHTSVWAKGWKKSTVPVFLITWGHWQRRSSSISTAGSSRNPGTSPRLIRKAPALSRISLASLSHWINQVTPHGLMHSWCETKQEGMSSRSRQHLATPLACTSCSHEQVKEVGSARKRRCGRPLKSWAARKALGNHWA